jgi:5'-3' exonuclease
LRAGLQAEKETVRRNQQLIRLKDDMQCELPWEDLTAAESDPEELRRLYSGWGFKNLLQTLEQTAPSKTEDLFLEHARAG